MGDLLETHKIMHCLEKIPEYTFFARADALGRGHCMKIYKEISRCEPRRNFFSQRVVIPWNALPEKVVSNKTTRLFKVEYDKCEGVCVCEATQVSIVGVVYQWTAKYMVSKPQKLR